MIFLNEIFKIAAKVLLEYLPLIKLPNFAIFVLLRLKYVYYTHYQRVQI